MNIDGRLLRFGSFLVIAGGIPLAVRAGFVARDLFIGWPSLWPLLLIGAGLGLVFARTRMRGIGGLVSVLTAGIMVGGLLVTGFAGGPALGACGGGQNAAPFADASGSIRDKGTIKIELSCGTLDVGTADGNDWAVSGRSPSGRPPTVESSSKRVRIASIADAQFNLDAAATIWHVLVPRAPELGLDVTVSAGSGTLDLSGARLKKIDLTLNAGSMNTDLSSAVVAETIRSTVNAGSATLRLPPGAAARLTLNAGSLAVCVAADAKVSVSWTGVLASNNLEEAGLVKTDGDHWVTPGSSGSPDLITLDMSANAGSFRLLMGDGCNE